MTTAHAVLVKKTSRRAMFVHRSHRYAFICAEKWRALKDCRFYDHGFNVEVWQNEILVHDVRHRDTITLPDAGPKVQWSFVRLRTFGKRRLIEIQLWAAPDKTTGIQTQKWFVYEWRNGHLKQDLELSLQKRKQLASGKFLVDPPVPHGLSAQVKHLKIASRIEVVRKIVWHCGRQRGNLGVF